MDCSLPSPTYSQVSGAPSRRCSRTTELVVLLQRRVGSGRAARTQLDHRHGSDGAGVLPVVGVVVVAMDRHAPHRAIVLLPCRSWSHRNLLSTRGRHQATTPDLPVTLAHAADIGRRSSTGLRLAASPLRIREQTRRIHAHALREPLHRAERQVPLPSLHATHVGAVDAEDVGELLLAQSARDPVGPQVASDDSLQLTFHTGQRWLVATHPSTYLSVAWRPNHPLEPGAAHCHPMLLIDSIRVHRFHWRIWR